MLNQTGIPAKEDIDAITPSLERLAKGPVAIVECFQEIPCDPCVNACMPGAITKPCNINDLPHVDHDKCNGCGICITQCQGLAIFVVDKSHSETHATIRLPYEFLPLPEEGRLVACLNRAGEEKGIFKVLKAAQPPAKNKTAVITIEVPQELAMEIRSVKVS